MFLENVSVNKVYITIDKKVILSISHRTNYLYNSFKLKMLMAVIKKHKEIEFYKKRINKTIKVRILKFHKYSDFINPFIVNNLYPVALRMEVEVTCVSTKENTVHHYPPFSRNIRQSLKALDE